MNIVFCADHGVWHALHVALFSVVSRFSITADPPKIHVVGNSFGSENKKSIQRTLEMTGKDYTLDFHRIEESLFNGFQPLNGSLGAYYKLVLPDLLNADHFLYLDCDILCDIDLSSLGHVNLGDKPVGWVSEAPLNKCADPDVAERLGSDPNDQYFNSGVLLVNRAAWEKYDVTSRCLDYLSQNNALIREQSALNVVLHQQTERLDECYNSIANMRHHWPSQTKRLGEMGKLLHFVDYPKPWDFLGEFIHPQHHIWREVLKKTDVRSFWSWQRWPSRKIPRSRAAFFGYKKSLKDKILFYLYQNKLMQPKGLG